jgi:hypothetical protein
MLQDEFGRDSTGDDVVADAQGAGHPPFKMRSMLSQHPHL